MPCRPSEGEDGRGSSQRHHGARLKVKIDQSVCDGADTAGGGARSHLVLLKSLEITLRGKQEGDTLRLLSFPRVLKSFSFLSKSQDE